LNAVFEPLGRAVCRGIVPVSGFISGGFEGVNVLPPAARAASSPPPLKQRCRFKMVQIIFHAVMSFSTFNCRLSSTVHAEHHSGCVPLRPVVVVIVREVCEIGPRRTPMRRAAVSASSRHNMVGCGV